MIIFAVTRDVKIPNRGTDKSAGIDIFVPKFNLDFMTDFNNKNNYTDTKSYFDNMNRIIIQPQGKVFIPTGLYVNFEEEENSALIAFNKGGVSWRDELTLLASVTDQDYQGELFITMTNYASSITHITENQKLTQLVRIPVYYDEIKIVDKNDIHPNSTMRGGGSLGSTGR